MNLKKGREMRKKTYIGTRTEYANEKIKELYDRINLTVPKGKKEEIKQVLSGSGKSVNEYIYMLICADLDSTGSRILNSQQEFTLEQRAQLDKWQVPRKYHEMIESMSYDKKEGYYIYLKEGYINDATGSRTIRAGKTQSLRMIVNKSRKA